METKKKRRHYDYDYITIMLKPDLRSKLDKATHNGLINMSEYVRRVLQAHFEKLDEKTLCEV